MQTWLVAKTIVMWAAGLELALVLLLVLLLVFIRVATGPERRRRQEQRCRVERRMLDCRARFRERD